MKRDPPPGWRLLEHESLPSTQDVAIAAARLGGADRLAVFSRTQEAGHGSHGRSWVAPAGNLNLSVVLEGRARPSGMGLWSLFAGIVLHSAVASLAGDGVSLKWPNDLMLGRAKLGGILIDSAMAGGGRLDWVVIGLGVNLLEAPAIEGRQTACLEGRITAHDLAVAILGQIDAWAGVDDETVRRTWLERAHPVGTLLTVLSPDGQRTGTFAGLSPAGELRLEEEARPLASAEVALIDPPLAAPILCRAPCC